MLSRVSVALARLTELQGLLAAALDERKRELNRIADWEYRQREERQRSIAREFGR
jgi:hypothetical protein